MAAIIGSGVNVGPSTVNIGYHTQELYIRTNGSTDAIVTLNGYQVHVPGTPANTTPFGYVEFEIDVSSFTVVSGNIDWYAIG